MSMTGQRISDDRIREIRALLEADEARGYDDGGNPFQNVIADLPEFDSDATAAAGIREEQDIYLLTDGTKIDGDGLPGWRIYRPGEWLPGNDD
jgi:hypothetical protein